MDTPIKTINCKGGYRVEIYNDIDAPSPRGEFSYLGTLYAISPDYNYDGYDINDLVDLLGGDVENDSDVWKMLGEKFYYRKVWTLNHSGVRVATGDENPWGRGWLAWDSGLVGVIVVSKEDAKKEWEDELDDVVKEKAEKILDGEIEDLDTWFRGDVYGYVVKDPTDTEVGSCWGYYAIEDAETEGVDAAEWCYKEDHEG